MRITAKGKVAYIKLEDKVSGALLILYMEYKQYVFVNNKQIYVPSGSTGELFAQAPVKEYPGIAVETVSDSSRYFVLRIQDDSGEDLNIYHYLGPHD